MDKILVLLYHDCDNLKVELCSGSPPWVSRKDTGEK